MHTRPLNLRLRSFTLRLASILGLLFSGIAAQAAPVKFDIPAQMAPPALMLFAKQAHVEVVFSADDLKTVHTNEVVGEFEPETALGRLLRDTGFEAHRNSSGKFVVAAASTLPGSVRGTLTAPNSRLPVDRAVVTVVETGATTRVGERGKFRISGLLPGTYTLVANAEGFSRLRVTEVMVNAGEETGLGVLELQESLRNDETQTMETVVVSSTKDVMSLSVMEVVAARNAAFTGTGNIDLPRTVNDVQPYYIWNASKIETVGATDVQDFFKKMVPMDANRQSTQQQPNGQPFSNISLGGFDNGGGANSGTQNTLVLVDGLPLPNTSYSTRTYGPNLSAIPMLAIDHIEVLPASSSAIYGAGAAGGVVNIVMKHEYTGAELTMTYDNTFDSDAPKKSVALSAGASLEGGKTKVLVSASYSTDNPLLWADRYRQVIKPYNDNFYSLYPGGQMTYLGLTTAAGAFTTSSAAYLNQPIITSANGTPLFAGTTATTIQVPVGYQSFQVNGIAPLQANIGKFDLSIPNTNTIQGTGGLQVPTTQAYTNKALSLGMRRQMTPWLELYGQYGDQSNYSPERISYSFFSSVLVPANAPGNPFGQAVKVTGVQSSTPGTGIIEYTTITKSASAGGRFTLPHEWKAELNYTWGLTDVTVPNNGSLDSTALAAAVTNGTLNLITDVSKYPFAASSYPGHSFSNQKTSSNDLQLKGVGPLMQLWAGAPLLAVGIEHKKNGGKGGYQDLTNPASATTPGVATTATLEQYVYWPGGSTSDDSAYSELTIPLLRKANKIPFMKLLDLQVAGRYDDINMIMTAPVQNITTTRVDGTKTYSPVLLTGAPEPFTKGTTTYKSTNETLGLKYKPVEGIFFRISYASAFIPPTYAQLVTPISTGTITQSTGAYPGVPTTSPWNYQSITDTQLGNAVYTVPVITGGNTNLKPETSKGINWGVVIEPPFIKGLRISLDYVKTTKHDAIITPTAATLIPYADSFPGRVVRGTPNAGQTVGPIVLIDNTAINAPELLTSSYNLMVNYTFGTSFGQWDFSTVATSWQHYKQQSIIGGPLSEGINNPNFTTNGTGLTLAKIKGNMTLDWTKGPFSAGWLTRYVGPYLLGSRYGIGGAFPVQGTVDGKVSSQIYHDAYVGYRLGKADVGGAWWKKALANTSLQVGVRNLFNRIPPYDELSNQQFQYYSSYGDIRLRTYYITLKKSF